MGRAGEFHRPADIGDVVADGPRRRRQIDGDRLLLGRVVARECEKSLLWRGEVRVAEANTITAEIVTVDGSLVEKLRIDPGTGWTQPIR